MARERPDDSQRPHTETFIHQTNKGRTMNFHIVGCNNVAVGENQQMVVNNTYYNPPGGGPSYGSYGHFGPRPPRGRHGGYSASGKTFPAGWPGYDQDRERREEEEVVRSAAARPTAVPREERDSAPTVKRAFISYYADTDVERNYVLQLADMLCGNGVDTMVDLYQEDDPPESWPSWVEQQITTRDVTLLICSWKFNEMRMQRASVHDQGRVHFEGAVMYSLLSKATPKRFIPIFLGEENPPRREYIPPSLQGTRVYHLRTMPPKLDERGHEDFTALYAFLTGQNRMAAPPIGSIVKLS